jgi:acyl carrier protein
MLEATEASKAGIAKILRDVLGLDDIELSVSFFDLGGTSIEAEQIAEQINAELGAAIRSSDVLAADELSDLVEIVRGQTAGAERA